MKICRRALVALCIACSAARADPLSVTELKERFFEPPERYFEHIGESVEVRGTVAQIERCPANVPRKCRDHFVLSDGRGGPRVEVCGIPPQRNRDLRLGDVVRVTGKLGRGTGGCPEQGTFAVLMHEKTLDAKGRRVLLGGGSSVANQEERPVDAQFQEAVKAGDASRAAALLERGADLESRAYGGGDTPLGYAAERGDIPMIALLLRRGARIEAAGDRGRTPLLIAVARGQEAAVQALLAAGANAAAVDHDGKPAIVLAAEQGSAGIARLLLAKGADKNARVVSGPLAKSTALIRALESRNAAAAMVLIEAGADVKAVGSIGETPLHACSESPPEICAALLARGAVLEARTPQGNTPLMSAAQDGNAAVVRLLLSRGADPNAKNAQGETALRLAEKGDHQGVIELLKPVTLP